MHADRESIVCSARTHAPDQRTLIATSIVWSARSLPAHITPVNTIWA